MEEQEKKEKKEKSKVDKTPGFTQRAGGFFTDLRGEARKIIWPSKKELQNKTVTVIITSLLFAAVIFCIDSVYNLGLELFVRFLG